jgi:hypothetical protein
MPKAKRRGRFAQKKSDPVLPPELDGIDKRLDLAIHRAGFTSADAVDKAADIAAGRTGRIIDRDRVAGIQAVTLVRLARALNVSAGWLITGEGGIEPHRAPLVIEERDES